MKKNKLKSDIQKKAAMLFQLHGIRAVKMDDIAGALKISKRTLYEVYDNKKDLLFDVLVLLEDKMSEEIKEHVSHCDNVMDMLIGFFSIRARVYSETNPLFFMDIKKYPELLLHFKERNEKHHRDTEKFFQKGVEEGFFLDTVNYKFLSRLCNRCLEDVRNNEEFQEFDIKELFNSFICVVIRGFCTAKGIEQLDRFLDELHKKS